MYKRQISSDLNNIARYYKKIGDYESALFYYKSALGVNRSMSLVARVKQDLENIIEVLDALGRTEEKSKYQKALEELTSTQTQQSEEQNI